MIHTIAEDCRTPLGPYIRVASKATLLRLFRYLGAGDAEMEHQTGTADVEPRRGASRRAEREVAAFAGALHSSRSTRGRAAIPAQIVRINRAFAFE